MADRLASVSVMHDVSPNFAITHADASRKDEVISLVSIHQQLSKLTASNHIISAEVAELKRSTSYSGNHRSRGVSRAETTSGRRCTAASMLRVFAGTIWSGASANKCADGCRKAGNDRAGR